jgi:magnesium transporter
MKVLAGLTIIMGIPTIIASLYGMNLVLPIQNDQNAFFIVLMISFAIMFFTYIVFKKTRWL